MFCAGVCAAGLGFDALFASATAAGASSATFLFLLFLSFSQPIVAESKIMANTDKTKDCVFILHMPELLFGYRLFDCDGGRSVGVGFEFAEGEVGECHHENRDDFDEAHRHEVVG